MRSASLEANTFRKSDRMDCSRPGFLSSPCISPRAFLCRLTDGIHIQSTKGQAKAADDGYRPGGPRILDNMRERVFSYVFFWEIDEESDGTSYRMENEKSAWSG